MSADVDTSELTRHASSNALGDLLRRTAARTPFKTALVYRSFQQTYAELETTVNRTANALADRGIGSGDRVALLSHNNHVYVIVTLALARLGAISVPINFMLNAAEVAFILGHSGAVGMVVEDALGGVADDAIAASGNQFVVRGVILDEARMAPEDWEDCAAWLTHWNTAPVAATVEDDQPIQIMYTSGTESRPKGATLSSRGLIAQYVSCIVDGEMSADDVVVHSMPLYHCAQQHCFLMPGIQLGATNIVLAGPQPSTIFAAIERYRANAFFAPPTIWIALLRHAEFDAARVSSLRKGYYGASIMPVEIVKELIERIPGLRLFNFYGQTEMCPVATVLKPEDQLRKLGSAGRAAINVETRIVDDRDEPVEPGTVGEIVHRSPHAMLGYWGDPEKTAAAFRNGWFHSGDLGVMDEDGYLRVVDRKKDMIKTGAENVASREVEDVLYAHPAVAEVAVFGVPHPHWIEAVVAAVVTRPGAAADAREIIQFCRERLAGYKTPKRVHVVERLPKNASGKILKRELRLTFARDDDAQAHDAAC
jgi:fatty-acyl-CoA synthase